MRVISTHFWTPLFDVLSDATLPLLGGLSTHSNALVSGSGSRDNHSAADTCMCIRVHNVSRETYCIVYERDTARWRAEHCFQFHTYLLGMPCTVWRIRHANRCLVNHCVLKEVFFILPTKNKAVCGTSFGARYCGASARFTPRLSVQQDNATKA